MAKQVSKKKSEKSPVNQSDALGHVNRARKSKEKNSPKLKLKLSRAPVEAADFSELVGCLKDMENVYSTLCSVMKDSIMRDPDEQGRSKEWVELSGKSGPLWKEAEYLTSFLSALSRSLSKELLQLQDRSMRTLLDHAVGQVYPLLARTYESVHLGQQDQESAWRQITSDHAWGTLIHYYENYMTFIRNEFSLKMRDSIFEQFNSFSLSKDQIEKEMRENPKAEGRKYKGVAAAMLGKLIGDVGFRWVNDKSGKQELDKSLYRPVLPIGGNQEPNNSILGHALRAAIEGFTTAYVPRIGSD